MIKNILLKTKYSNCKILVGNNFFLKILKENINKKNKVFIIIDSKVYKFLKNNFKNNKDIEIIKINGSEKIKNLQNYSKLIIKLLEKKIDRSSIIISIGGGTIGDLSGFVASTILRGIDFILVPTTLLSQVDASIGGKNGINTKYGKNLIGTFFQPQKVLIDTLFLKSLPSKQIKSGYAEIVKHSIINDKKFYKWLKANHNKIFKLNEKILIEAIVRSIKIKSKFVNNDERENLLNSYSRAMLNFGHTFGHAIESLNNYKSNLSHGEAVAIGMILAAKISYRLNKISKNQLYDLINHFKDVGLPTKTKLIDNKNFFKKIMNDKKNINNKINLILLKNIGTAYYARNYNIKNVEQMVLETKYF